MSTPPIRYSRQSDFTLFSTEQFPTTGQGLEAEFNKLVQSVDQTQDRLAEIQRDDGLLRNLSVHPDALGEAIRALLGADAGTPKGNWQTGLIYDPKDVVMFGGVSYLAVVEHVAGADFNADLAAGKWLPLSSANDGGSLRIDLASTVDGKGAELVQYNDDETVKQRLDTLGNLRADLSSPTGGAALVGYTSPSTGIATTIKAFLDSLWTAGAATGAALIQFLQDGTGTVARTVQSKLRDYVTGEDFGVVGDGVTDDLAALTNAVTRAVARGVPLVLDGTKSYALSNLWTIPANARIQTNGATFIDSAGAGTSNGLLVDVGAGARIDKLVVTIGAGLGRQRCIRATGDCEIGEIKVTYTDQQTTDDNTDAAVRFTNCTKLRVGRVEVTKHDRPMSLETCTDVLIGGIKLTSYVRGLYLFDCTDAKIGKSRIATASPNASITAGHCGVLVESSTTDATRNLTLEDFNIENAGEHGIRIAGPEQLSNIYIVRPRIKGCGASGIKILGTDTGAPTSRKKRISITDPIIEDCGTANNNRCGILAQYCDDVFISNPIIRKQAGANSSHTGIRLTSCSMVHIVEPQISDALFYGIWLDGAEGNIDNVSITGGVCKSNADTGLRLSTLTATFNRINVQGLALDSNTTYGFTAGGNFTSTDIRAKTFGNGSACNVTSANVFIDITGLPGATAMSAITAMNSSRWSDGTTLNIRKAGAWSAL